MAAKKTTKKAGAAGSVKAARGKGKPFEKENAYRWRKGVSGNPSGTSKAQTLSAAYRHALKQPLPDGSGRTYADLVADTLVIAAVAGDVGAAKELADRTEGKAKQAVELNVDRAGVISRAIETLMSEAGISREAAVRRLRTIAPEIQWE